jgi:hypothetical protein
MGDRGINSIQFKQWSEFAGVQMYKRTGGNRKEEGI